MKDYHPEVIQRLSYFEMPSFLIVSMQSTAPCRTESTIVSTATGHVRPFAHDRSLHIFEAKLKAVVEADTCDILWSTLRTHGDNLQSYKFRLKETSITHKQTGSFSFIKVILESEWRFKFTSQSPLHLYFLSESALRSVCIIQKIRN